MTGRQGFSLHADSKREREREWLPFMDGADGDCAAALVEAVSRVLARGTGPCLVSARSTS
jgi:hypothetical protein